MAEDFSTEAALDIVVREQQLRQVREQIEERLQGIEVGVEDGVGGGGRPPEMRPDGGGRGLSPSRERRFARREHRWARQRTSDVSDLLTAVRDLGEGGGGLLGGLLDDVLGTAGEGAGAGALTGAAAALTGSAKALGIAAAALGGSEVLDFITGSESISLDDETLEQIEQLEDEGISLDIPEEGVPVDVPEEGLPVNQETDPIDVDDPSPLSVDDPSPLSVDTPDALAVKNPSPLGVADPSPLGVADPSPLTVDAPDSIPVDAPTSIPVTGLGLGFGGITQIANGGGDAPPDLMDANSPGPLRPQPGGGGGGGRPTNPFVEEFGRPGLVTEPAFRYGIGVRNLVRGVAGGSGGGEGPSGPTSDPFFLPPENGGDSAGGGSGSITQTIDIDQEASAEIGRIDLTVEAAFDELKRELERNLLDEIEDVERSLQRQISDLKDDIKR